MSSSFLGGDSFSFISGGTSGGGGGGLSVVGLTMPSAFCVCNSPLTSDGTIVVTGSGTCNQAISGNGILLSAGNGISIENGFICNTSSSIIIEGDSFGSTIRCGVGNFAYSAFGAALGGCNNTSCNQSSFVGGGQGNASVCQYSFIGGGRSNTNCGCDSFIGGGIFNNICCNSNRSTIVGGCLNNTIGQFSFVAGGACNTASAPYSGVFGYNVCNTTACSFMSNNLIACDAVCGGFFQADITPSNTTTQEGKMVWNVDEGTMDLGMGGGLVTQQIGQEIYYRVQNNTASTLPEAKVLMSVGTTGASGNILADLAIGNGSVPSKYILGLSTEDISNVSPNNRGFVTQFGKVRGIQTDGANYGETWVDGDVLYLSPTTAGGLTKVVPSSPNLKVVIAQVIHAAATNGCLFIRVTANPKINDIENVNAPTPSNNDTLLYNSATCTWCNGSIPSTSIMVVGSGTCSTIRCGVNNNAIGNCSFAGGGSCNVVCTQYSTISGGYGNTVSGYYGSIFGGVSNNATGTYSSIVGGFSNRASSTGSFTGGGYQNCSNGGLSSVVGGRFNVASSQFSSVVGGCSNTASADYAFIGGGQCNNSSNTYSSVVGGLCNIASGSGSFVGGGKNNTASFQYTFIGGGRQNTSSNYGSVVGGRLNCATGYNTFVGNGRNNSASGYCSAILGGENVCTSTCYSGAFGYNICNSIACSFMANNFVVGDFVTSGGLGCNVSIDSNGKMCLQSGATPSIMVVGSGISSTLRCGISSSANGNYSAVLSGFANSASAYQSIVVGGFNNTSSGAYTFTGGGTNNCNTGCASTIIGGRHNTACFSYSSIVGGCRNTASNYYSSVGGGFCNISNANSSVVSGGACNIASGYRSTISGGYKNTNCGFTAFIGGGQENTISAYSTSCAIIVGGWRNQAFSDYGTILGGQCNLVGAPFAGAFGCNLVNCNACTFMANNFVVGDFSNGTYNGCSLALDANGKMCIGSGGGASVMNAGSGCCSIVGSGLSNTASGSYSFTGGGRYNTSSGYNSLVVGGSCNTASAYGNSILSGYRNQICSGAESGAIINGSNNVIKNSSFCSFMGNGGYNTIDGTVGVIVNGGQNCICNTAGCAFIGNGVYHTISGNGSATISGYCNTVSGRCSAVVTGRQNTASGILSFVGGGLNNISCLNNSFIGGGQFNTLSTYGTHSTIVGGCCNTITNGKTFIGGGVLNTVSGGYSFVGGGTANLASGYNSAVVAGGRGFPFGVSSGNCATGAFSFVGGGGANIVTGGKASILGGVSNTVSNYFSNIVGSFLTSSADCTTYTNALSKTSGTFRISHPDPSKTSTKYLQHSFVESPTRGDNIYRFKVETIGCNASLALPDYYKFLNGNDQVWISPKNHFGSAYGVIDSTQSCVSITSNCDGEYNVLVIGTRKDIDAKNGFLGVEVWK